MRKFEEEYYYDSGDEIEHDILTPREAMDFLACGRSLFYKLVNSGELPAFRIGKQWRISKSELQLFIKHNCNR